MRATDRLHHLIAVTSLVLATAGLAGAGTDGDARAATVLLVPCPADVNGDGVVDVQDAVEVILAWGPCP